MFEDRLNMYEIKPRSPRPLFLFEKKTKSRQHDCNQRRKEREHIICYNLLRTRPRADLNEVTKQGYLHYNYAYRC